MSDTPAEIARQVVKEVVRDNTVGTDLPGVRRVIRWDLFTARLETAIAAELDRKDERIRELEQECKWVCFHCGFATGDPLEAANHFGDRDDESPLCITWGSLDAEGRASEYQSVIGELNAERDENIKLRTANEGLEYRLLEYENLVGSRFKGCRSINDAFNLYDSMEGRALAADERVRELEQEQQAHFALEDMVLRAKAEQIAGLEQANKEAESEFLKERARVKELEEALRVYADKSNWRCARCGKADHLNCHMGRYTGPCGHDHTNDSETFPLRDCHGYTLAADALDRHASPNQDDVAEQSRKSREFMGGTK